VIINIAKLGKTKCCLMDQNSHQVQIVRSRGTTPEGDQIYKNRAVLRLGVDEFASAQTLQRAHASGSIINAEEQTDMHTYVNSCA